MSHNSDDSFCGIMSVRVSLYMQSKNDLLLIQVIV